MSALVEANAEIIEERAAHKAEKKLAAEVRAKQPTTSHHAKPGATTDNFYAVGPELVALPKTPQRRGSKRGL